MLTARWFLPVVFASFSLASLSAESSSDELSSFLKKWQASVAQTPPQEQGFRRDALSQFRVLESLLKRKDYSRAQQTLQNLNGYGLPPELQDEWQSISDELALEITEEMQKAAIANKRQVDELAEKVRAIALEAKTSAALDEVMVEIAAIQVRRPSSYENNLLGQRANQKLEGLARFVDQWSRFLDLKEAGNEKQANNIIRNLIQGGSDFHVLSSEQLQKEFLTETREISSIQEAGRVAFDDLKFPEGLPAAIEKLNVLLKNPSMSGSGQNWDAKGLLALVTADQQIRDGDFAGAEQSLKSLESNNILMNAGRPLQAIKEDLAAKMVSGRIEQITQIKLQPGETTSKMLARSLDKLKEEGKYSEMANLITSVTRVPSSARSSMDLPWSSGDSIALAAYVGASQFEKAGDVLPAINEYRRVITSGQTGKYAPTQEAQQALERLKKSNPEAFTDVNGLVLEELRRIRQEVSQAMRMQRSGPPGMYP